MAYQFNGFKATKPVARSCGVKDAWEVFFALYDPTGAKHNMRFKKGINCLPVDQRRLQAQANADVLWEALNNKWNPLVDKYPHFSDKTTIVLFAEGLDQALEEKKKVLSKFSLYDYSGCVRFMKAASKKTGHYYSRLSELEKKDIRIILNQARETNKWNNQARNKYLSIFRALLSVMVDQELIKFNPAKGIKDEPVDESMGYKRLTDEEKETIADHLLLKFPDFFEYLMFIYDDGIRRKETLLLQIKDFNLTTREILIRPEVAKTNKARIVPITDTLMQILLRREIWSFPSDYFLFSNDKFKPGAAPYHPNVPTSWWRKLVIEDLKIDCKMYSLKHRGADDKLLAGIDLDTLRTLYGHKSKQMTEVYARAVKGKYKQKIIDNAPVFAKVVEMKKRVN